MQKPTGREFGLQAADQGVGKDALGRADRIGIPLPRLEIVDRNEGRLAPHGQPNVPGQQRRIDLFAQDVQIGPGSL